MRFDKWKNMLVINDANNNNVSSRIIKITRVHSHLQKQLQVDGPSCRRVCYLPFYYPKHLNLIQNSLRLAPVISIGYPRILVLSMGKRQKKSIVVHGFGAWPPRITWENYTYVFAFHLISLFRSIASLDSTQGFGIFFGMMRPSGSSRTPGADVEDGTRCPEDAMTGGGPTTAAPTRCSEMSFSSWTIASAIENDKNDVTKRVWIREKSKDNCGGYIRLIL